MKSAALDSALRELERPQVGDARLRPARTISSPGALELGPFIVAHALGASRTSVRWTLACAVLGTFGAALLAAAPTRFEEQALALGVVVLATIGAVLARRGRRVLLVHAHGFAVAEDDAARGCGYAEISRLFVRERRRWPDALRRVRRGAAQTSEAASRLGPTSGALDAALPLTLTVHAGARAPITLEAHDASGVRALRELIRRAAPILLPRLSADLYAGADCDFGALHLSRARLAVDGRHGRVELALTDVARVALEGSDLVIDADRSAPRRFAAIPRASVANLAVLEPLLARVCPHAELALVAPPAPTPGRRPAPPDLAPRSAPRPRRSR